MGTAAQELRVGMPGSSLRKFLRMNIWSMCAFQKLRKHCISCLLKIVAKTPMTYYFKNFLHLSLSEVCILCPTLHQAASWKKLYLKSSKHKNKSIFPIKNGGCFLYARNSNNQAFTSHTQTRKQWFRASIEECNQKVLRKKKALKNKNQTKSSKKKGGEKQHYLIKIFV